MSSTEALIDILDTGKNGTYIDFENKIMQYSKNRRSIIFCTLKAWYTLLSKKCLRCDKDMIIYKECEQIKYYCKDFKILYPYFYKDVEEEYIKKNIIKLL